MQIEVSIKYILFNNPSNHYVVCTCKDLETKERFTAAGTIVDALVDNEYVLEGDFVDHPKYGNQFKVVAASKKMPSNEDTIVEFLSGDHFPTIGKKTAQSIYDILGEHCLDDIAADPSLLYQIPKLNEKKDEHHH